MKRVLFSALTVAVLVGGLCETGIAGGAEPCADAAKLGQELVKLIADAPKKGGVIELANGCAYELPAPKEGENGADAQKGKRGSAVVISNKEMTINGNGAVLTCKNRCNILRANDSEITINAVTFTGSSDTAIAVPFGNLTLTGVTVVGNFGDASGGIAMGTGVVTLDNSRVEYNLTGSGGGGIGVVAGTLNLRNKSSVSNNVAMTNELTIAGGIFSVGGKVSIEDSTVNGNTAGNGGGIYATMDGTVDVRRSVISGNTGIGDSKNPEFPVGGGITADRDVKVKIGDSTMADNMPKNCLVVPREGATTTIDGCQD